MIRTVVALLLATLALRAQGPPVPAQPPIFRAGVETVLVYASVQDASGAPVGTLTRDDFEVRDDGRPVPLSVFSRERQPITAVVLLDLRTLGHRRHPLTWPPGFPRTRAAAFALIDALHADDRLSLGSFNEEIDVSPVLTGDRAILHRVAAEELWAGWHRGGGRHVAGA